MRTLLIAISVFLIQGAVPGGSISGRILSMSGAPAVNVRVQALQLSEDPNTPANAIFVFGLTDTNGAYRLENVPPGRYYVAVGGVETPTYFPGVAAAKDASAVPIRGGENLTGFDFKMVIPAPLKISGHVNSPNRGIVRLSGPRTQINAVSPDGSFQFTTLTPGNYEISVLGNTLNAAELQPVRITLIDRDVTDVELGIPPATVSVSVAVEREGPLPRFELSFTSDSAGTAGSTAPPTAAYFIVPGLRVNLLPGKYRATVSGLPDGYSVRSIETKQMEIRGTATLNVASRDIVDLAISLAVSNPPPWVRVRGKVTGPERTNIRTVEMSGASLSIPASAPVSPDGSFEFPMILAGTYAMRPSPPNGYFPRTLVVAHEAIADAEISPATKKHIVGEFAPIMPGEFMMGCSPGDRDCLPEEMSAHKVRITRGFEIGRFEVTQLQWETVMGSNPSQFKGETLPVENINTWAMVEEFLARLNALNDGYRYRLPTEGEWEYAARAGSTGPSFAPIDTIAWHGGNSVNLQTAILAPAGPGFTLTHPVGQLLPNAWGLFDTQGNVWEWTSDWYAADYYKVSPEADPKGPETGPMRVMKGGSAAVAPQLARVSMRGNQLPSNPSYIFGLRLVRESAR